MSQKRPETSRVGLASEQVAAIVGAAERTAEELRAQAERLARERIAEADRAAQQRVSAAVTEAAEITTEARQQAEEILRHAQNERSELLADATRVGEEVLARGLDLSRALEQLGASLQANARRVLDDVRRAHAQLTVPLREGASEAESRRLPAPPSAVDELEPPAFVRRR
jgi:cell division septum initiation protein DivIVA